MRALIASLLIGVAALAATGPFLGVEFTPSGQTLAPALTLGLSGSSQLNGVTYTLDIWVSSWRPIMIEGWWGAGLRLKITPPFTPHLYLGAGIRAGARVGSDFTIISGYWTPFVSANWTWKTVTIGIDFWLPRLYADRPFGGPYLALYAFFYLDPLSKAIGLSQ